MSELKATRGPWRVVRDKQGRINTVESTRDHYKPGSVANVLRANAISCPTLGEGIANAHLIAAAPDLYAALDACNPVPGGTADRLRKSAMAKARGETE